jgi:3-oxoacyl-[acyl-carrier protein] reductase
MADLLKGKVAVITGAARGMGRAIAKTFAYEGAAVGLLDIQEEQLNQTVKEIQAENGKALGLVTDVRYYEQVERAIQSIMKSFSTIDILVNSAGLSGNGLVHKISEADWDMCFDVNVKGTFLLCKAVVPVMLKQKQGQIINIASLSAWIRGAGGATCYGASKYAIRGFSRYLAVELRPSNIKVCCLSPGTTDSHFRGHPTGNPDWMTPEDIASAALFIASQRDRTAVAELAISMVNEIW